AAAGDGAAALHALPRARFAYGKQLPWLRYGANQVTFSSGADNTIDVSIMEIASSDMVMWRVSRVSSGTIDSTPLTKTSCMSTPPALLISYRIPGKYPAPSIRMVHIWILMAAT
ncbi:hypothetical protein XocUg1_21675, partial [Xanthomonas oryzae pv. oryzicola]|uniref:hypothetical protein n=1 Tax=Xanthomonas oryzae TaxID=347 RepID=UPI002DF5C26D|nr:hypothetical protein [Xanthomonas oryzae pv. oryzicola]